MQQKGLLKKGIAILLVLALLVTGIPALATGEITATPITDAIPFDGGWAQTGVTRFANIAAFLDDTTVPAVPGGWGTAPTGTGAAGAGMAGSGSILQVPLDYLETTGSGSVNLANFRSSVQGQGRSTAANGAMAFMAFNGLRTTGASANIGIGWNTNNAGGAQLNLALPAAGAPAVDVTGALLADFTANVGVGADLLYGAAADAEWPLVDTIVMQANFTNGTAFGTAGPAASQGARVARVTIESGTAPAFSALHGANPHTWAWPATVNDTDGLGALETTAGSVWRTVGATAEITPGDTDTVFVFHLDEPVPMRYVRANIELFLPEGHRGGGPAPGAAANIFPAQIAIASIEAYNTQAPAVAATQPALVMEHTTTRHALTATSDVIATYELNGFTLQGISINGQALANTDFTSSVTAGVASVTFANAFLASLGLGNHSVEASFTYDTFTETLTHTLQIHNLTGQGWNTVTAVPAEGALAFPSLAAFLDSANKPQLPLGFWGTAANMPGLGGAGTTGPENMLVIDDFDPSTGWLGPDTHFRRAVTGQQANPPNAGSHAFMAFNGIRTIGPYLNSGIGWNTNGAGAQNLDLTAQAGAPGSPVGPDGLTVNTGIGADLLQGLPVTEPWPLVDTIVMQAQWANTGAPFTAPQAPAARIGQITIESGTAPAFNALSTTNAHVWNWPVTANNTADIATLETAEGALWRTFGAPVMIEEGNAYTVFVFHLDEPVPMRYLRANIEMVLPPGHAGGAGTFPASIGINFIEVYNTQAPASRPWILPSESTANFFLGAEEAVVVVYRANAHDFSHIYVGGVRLESTDFTLATDVDGLLTVTFAEAFLNGLTVGEHSIEAFFVGHTNAVRHALLVLPTETDTPGFTVEAIPIRNQPSIPEVRNSEIVVPQADGSLVYTEFNTHDSLARGAADENPDDHRLEGNIMPDFSNVGFREGREDIPFLDDSNSYVLRLYPELTGDDTARINAAIEYVGAQPVGAHGFRGVVELAHGTFRVSGQQGVLLNQSGVVLRGSGQGPDGTILLYTHRPGDAVLPNAHIFRNLGVAITLGTAAYENLAPGDGTYEPGVIAGSGRDQSLTFSNEREVAPGWYPVGSNTITLTSTDGFAVGDRIQLVRTPSRSWVDIMNLTSAGNWGFPHDNPALNVGDGALNYQLHFERVITAIDGNEITLHLPLVHGLNIPTDDTAVVRLINEGRRVVNVGVENLRIVAARDQDNLMNINRGRTAVRAIGVRDGFVRDTTSIFFPFGHTNLYHNATNISVLNNSYLSPAVELTISARLYGFTIDHGTNSLFDGNYVQGARYEFVTGARVAGPNVFLDGVGEASRIGSENHHRWATGTLFDNIRMLEGNDTFLHAGPGINPPVSGNIGQIRVENRGNNGTGQGWTATSTVFWNPVSNDITHSRPPTGQNFVVGRGAIYDNSIVRHQGNAALGNTVIRGGIAGPGSTATMTALVQALWDMYGVIEDGSNHSIGAHVENLDFRVNPGSLYRAQVAVRDTGEYWNAIPNRPLLQRPMPDTWVDTDGFVISGLHDPEATSVAIYINGVFHADAILGTAGNGFHFTYTAQLTPGYHSIATRQTVNDMESHMTALRFVNVREDGVHDQTASGFDFTQANAGTQDMVGRGRPTVEIDRTDLAAAIEAAEAREEATYTPATWEAFAEALAAAEAVYADADATQTEINAATQALTTAMNALTRRPAGGGGGGGGGGFIPPPQQGLPGTPFTDVNANASYANAIRWAYQQGLMNGTSATTFEPHIALDRAMLATILHRHADQPQTAFRPVFSDVGAGQWYSLGIVWASEQNVVNGVGGGRFAPTVALARQELAVMLHRYAAEVLGEDMTVPAGAQVPPGTALWAADAMRWAMYHNLLVGTGAPSAAATRADVAEFLHRFLG